MTAQGRLPALRALMRHGVYSRLKSSANANPISAWSSLLTGVNPGMHGMWGLNNLIPGTYEFQPPHARMLRAPTLAQLLTDRGREAGTLFVPMTYPARESEWTTVSGWLAPSVEAEGFAYPARVADVAARHMEDQPLDIDLSGYVASGRYEEGLQAACAAMEAKCELAEEMLGDRSWDLLALSLIEVDRVQRWYWHLRDQNHPEFESDLAARHGDCVERIYIEADRLIGQLSARLSPEDQLIVVSTYGMGINHGAAGLLPEILEWLGLLTHFSPAGGLWNRLGDSIVSTLGAACRLIRGLLPGFMDRVLPHCGQPVGPGVGERASGIDYERSAVLPAPGGHLLLNLEGEFPRGTVNQDRGSRLASQITAALAAGIDPANGRQPLEAVLKRDDVCHGPYARRIPHLVLNWRATTVVEGMTVTPRDGHVRVATGATPHHPSGAPAPEGIFIAAGAGLRRAVRLEGIGLEDVTATALYLCGDGVPSYFDGRVLREGILPGYMDSHPVVKFDRDLPKIIDDAERSERISDIVAAHLANRGYAD